MPLCANWKAEDEGWTKVECVLDSGASESVCPRTMAPHWPIEDSPGSTIGLHYTSASGGRMPNEGQQRLPIALGTGTRTMALFQVAEVSRPLMSVARVCEAGNQVLFGVGGGVIRNLSTGNDTPFEKRDGVYVFSMWIAPVSAVKNAPAFAGHP